MDEKCEFCNERAGGAQNTFRRNFGPQELESRVLAEYGAFSIIVGVGALTEGYVLVLPNMHVRSFGYIALSDQFEALGVILQCTREVCEEFYQQPYVFFEHGSYSDEKPGGSCLDHAHIHGIPLRQSITDDLGKAFHSYRLTDLVELQTPISEGRPYLFVEDQAGRRLLYSIPDNLPSQYLRRVWARAIGRNDDWDWALYLGKENMAKTYNDLSPLLRRAFAT